MRERDPRGIRPARPMYAASGMGARGREVEAPNRCLRTSEAGHGPEDELLVQLRRAGADRAADEVGVPGLEIAGAHHVTSPHDRTEAGRELLDLALHTVGEPFESGSIEGRTIRAGVSSSAASPRISRGTCEYAHAVSAPAGMRVGSVIDC